MSKDMDLGFVGLKIKDVRLMTEAEMRFEFWHNDPPFALVLEDGTKLYPSCDSEGNGPGAFLYKQAGKALRLSKSEDRSQLIDRTITGVVSMSPNELRAEFVAGSGRGLVVRVGKDIKLIVSCDQEGNSPGTLFGKKDGKGFWLLAN